MKAPNFPPEVQSALDTGRAAVLLAVQNLRNTNEDLALATLWALHKTQGDPEYGRTLAIEIVRDQRARLAKGSIALACRLWLMAHDWRDLGIANTLLGALEAEAVELAFWPAWLGGEFLDFLEHCLTHPQVSVKAAVLSVLRLASSDAISRAVPAASAVELAEKLERIVPAFADDEETKDLNHVLSVLRSTQMHGASFRPEELIRVSLDLRASQREWPDLGPSLDDLTEFVRRRALLDDAAQQALEISRPLQTLRSIGDRLSAGFVQAFVSLANSLRLSVASDSREDDVAEDSSIQIAWAPGASVPIHLLHPGQQARLVFDLLRRLMDAGPSGARATILSEDPAVAEALLRLSTSIKTENVTVELILTDLSSPRRQTSLTLDIHSIAPLLDVSVREEVLLQPKRKTLVARQDVPQANTVRQVFEAIDATLAKGSVDVEDISNITSKRQVDYYKQGARILGFLDDDNIPTSRAYSLVGLEEADRLAIAALYFEDSAVGRAWRSWAGKRRLADVDPANAGPFLQQCVVGLTGTTPARRASTLRKWHAELMPYYPKSK